MIQQHTDDIIFAGSIATSIKFKLPYRNFSRSKVFGNLKSFLGFGDSKKAAKESIFVKENMMKIQSYN